MVYCDNEKRILSWGSEEIVVPYMSPIDNRMHRYYVDFIIEILQKNETTHKLGFPSQTLIFG